VAERAIEHGKVTYIPSRNTVADCFVDRGGAKFNARKTFIKKKASK
jgi:hypothetical protein